MHRYAKMKENGEVKEVYEQNHPLDLSTVKRVGGNLMIRPVEVIGRRDDYDRELYSLIGPEYEVEAMKVVERYRLEPRKNFDAVLHRRVDERVERRRSSYMPDQTLGGALTIFFKLDEARRFKDDPDPDLREYPFIQQGLDLYGTTPEEVADNYMTHASGTRMAFAMFERVRAVTHGAIESAETHEDKVRIFESMKFDTGDISPSAARRLK